MWAAEFAAPRGIASGVAKVLCASHDQAPVPGDQVTPMLRFRSVLVVALAVVVTLVSSTLAASDPAGAVTRNGPALASSGGSADVGSASDPAADSGPDRSTSPGMSATPRPAVSKGWTTPRATAGTTRGAGTAHTAAPAQTSMGPATFGAAAICDGATGTWNAIWYIQAVQDRITVTAANDPVNGVTLTPAFNTSATPLGRVEEKVQLPGSATAAALTATITLPDGTSTVENRTVQLGTPCTVQAAPVCDPSQEQINFSTAAGQVFAVVTGPCAGNQFPFVARMTSNKPDGRILAYAVARAFAGIPSGTRQVIAADLPPCQWTAALLNGTPGGVTYSGGSGVCTDVHMTITEGCPQQFVLTLTTGADAALPTTFGIFTQTATGPGEVFRQVAPGHTVTFTVGPTGYVWVDFWGSQLGDMVWQRSHMHLSPWCIPAWQ